VLTFIRSVLAAAGAAAAFAALAAPAAAQTPLPLADWQYSTGEVLAPLAGPLPEWRITLGAGAMLRPDYEGARRYQGEPSFIADIRYRDLAFASDGEGIGVNLLHGPGYRAGIAISYDLGRDQHDDPHLKGLGNIGAAPEPKLFAQYFLLPFVLTADLRKGLGGHEGLIGDLGAYVPLPILKGGFLFLGPTVTFADSRYMRSYFGVDDAQAAASGLPRFSADGGLKSTGLGATAVYFLDKHWLLLGDAAYERLLGSAAASPITETRSQFTIDFNIAYKF